MSYRDVVIGPLIHQSCKRRYREAGLELDCRCGFLQDGGAAVEAVWLRVQNKLIVKGSQAPVGDRRVTFIGEYFCNELVVGLAEQLCSRGDMLSLMKAW